MSLFQKHTKTFQWGRHTVTMETGEIARQATGAVLVNMDDTVVLATVVASKSAKPGQDFFPLTVDYQEKFYAGGRIPGGFFKREGRPSEKETLTSRLIDRPIRPLFVKGFKNEVQVICTVLSADMVVPHDILAINGEFDQFRVGEGRARRLRQDLEIVHVPGATHFAPMTHPAPVARAIAEFVSGLPA